MAVLPPGGFNPYTYVPSATGYHLTDPSKPPPKQDGGNWIWDAAKGVWNFLKSNAGDVLQTAGGVVEGMMSSADRAKQLEELKRQYDASLKQRQSEYDRDLAEQIAGREQSGGQFDRTTGDTEAQAAVRAQTQLNAAPVADKAQALLLARMGVSPGQFQPRDYTKGTADLSRVSMAPGANVTSAMRTAAQGYRPGQGGVDTSAIRMLLAKMKASGFGPQQPTTMGSGQPPMPPGPGGPVVPPTDPTTPRLPGGGHLPTSLGQQGAQRPMTADEILRRRMGVTQ